MLTKPELVNEIIRLADLMASGAASMGGMGYDQLISSREQLKDLLNRD